MSENDPLVPDEGPSPYQTSHPLSWAGSSTAVVIGGPLHVSSADLTDLATTLTSAAAALDDARTQAQGALFQAQQAVAPVDTEEVAAAGGLGSGGSVQILTRRSTPFPTATALTLKPAARFEVARSEAVDALNDLSTGPGSLDAVAASIRVLAADLSAGAELYTSAENQASSCWGPDQALGLLSGTSTVLGLGLLGEYLTLTASVGLWSQGGTGLSDADADLLQGVSMVLSDSTLAEWVRRDLVLLVALGMWARRADTGKEGAWVQAYLAHSAKQLDLEISQALPETIAHGSTSVPTSSLSPVQRVATYLAMTAATSAAQRHGERTGVTVTPRGGSPVTVPPGGQDPFGLGTSVPVSAQGLVNVAPPASAAALIRYSASMKAQDKDETTGVVSILRTDHADGTRSWTVVVPGTTDWGSGDSNPQDLLTNFEAVAGVPTDMESAVVTAMRQAGVGPGEEVALYGHSQGAITAANIAADPAVTSRYNVTTLLTAGGPVAGAVLPESVNALHVENTGDAVPSLDGRANPDTATRMTLLVDTSALDRPGYPHGAGAYADAVEGLGGDPAVDAWSEQLAGVTGAGEQGAQTTEIVFDVERLTPVSQWEREAQEQSSRGPVEARDDPAGARSPQPWRD